VADFRSSSLLIDGMFGITGELQPPKALIRYRVNLQAIKSHLSNPDYLLEHIPNQTVLILQGGGALGAFVCGVMKALEEAKIYPDIVAGVSIAGAVPSG
jgi:predicted acylesterase/phospholipase RssA